MASAFAHAAPQSLRSGTVLSQSTDTSHYCHVPENFRSVFAVPSSVFLFVYCQPVKFRCPAVQSTLNLTRHVSV